MFAKTCTVALTLSSLLVCAFGAPYRIDFTARNDGNTVPVVAEPPIVEMPVTELDDPITPEEAAPAADRMATEGAVPTTMPSTEEVVMNIEPLDEPMSTPEEIEEVSNSSETIPHYFVYNIGGKSFDEVKADPTEYLVGETLAFEMPEAIIAGAKDVIADLYKSHRYGMLGSIWGYDIPVQYPGYYACSMHYCETYSENFVAESRRKFEVTIIGDASPETEHREEFDVMEELGYQEFTAYNRTFENIAISEILSIREKPTTGDAFLSGISCIYTAPLN
ncbi:hypothetical protein BWQ96_07201 [Gracilariopsis chorda]|uniref:Malectin domain-containing protein n=1 Tax=Gracilariopsis chorda TaxID=448386 RepID=A0A2V3ILU0_9FLOR|nr:hypothetical protein BWQ96_07201 [Gracilariopsis chorda]|eukprot:PXF43054.1 hypothetical protein BWQ96_07201 [Gracilariopsis chorda]